MNLFNHQKAAYEQIVALAQTYFQGHWQRLDIQTRWHTLLLGPTGVGKSAMAKMVARATGAAVCQINLPSWMPSGAHDRATAQTLPLILKHIVGHPRTLLFLDEFDKAHANAGQTGSAQFSSPWMSYIRSELYELLDGRWPAGIKFERDEEDDESASGEHLSGEKLRTKTFVLAAGTFQFFYDIKPSRSVGFHKPLESCTATLAPSYDTIIEMMPRELGNRFGHFVALPQLTAGDYRNLARQAEARLPKWITPAFRHAVSKRLSQAIETKAGCRFVELALAEALQTWERHLPADAGQSRRKFDRTQI